LAFLRKQADLIPGGLADDKNAEDLARKHEEDAKKLREQLSRGVEVEMEHTTDSDKAKEIAEDHLDEIPDYYDRLDDMEEEAEEEEYE
jgi:hypothetical protein